MRLQQGRAAQSRLGLQCSDGLLRCVPECRFEIIIAHQINAAASSGLAVIDRGAGAGELTCCIARFITAARGYNHRHPGFGPGLFNDCIPDEGGRYHHTGRVVENGLKGADFFLHGLADLDNTQCPCRQDRGIHPAALQL